MGDVTFPSRWRYWPPYESPHKGEIVTVLRTVPIKALRYSGEWGLLVLYVDAEGTERSRPLAEFTIFFERVPE